MSYNFKDILKKFWFVILVGLIFVSIAIYFAWDTNKDTIGAKSSKGKDVIFTLADKNYTADDYYTSLFEKTASGSKTNNGVQLTYLLLERKVIDQSVKTTDKMKDEASKKFKDAETYYKQSYGDKYESTMNSQLRQLGYSGVKEFEDFFLDKEKADKFNTDYVEKHPELFDAVAKTKSPRVISHILVSVSTTDKSTDEEKAAAEEKAKVQMNKIDEALKKDSFKKVAKEYSEDTGSVEQSGSLGIQINTASLDETFKKKAWELKSGEVSGWVKSQYGYHKIKIDTTDVKEMATSKDYKESMVAAINAANPNLAKEIVWNKAKKLKMKIKDKDLEKALTEYISQSVE